LSHQWSRRVKSQINWGLSLFLLVSYHMI
jgi:hypothetical protein